MTASINQLENGGWTRPIFSWPGRFALLNYYLLFPGFFIYHYLVAISAIPAVFGGWFSVVSLFALFMLGPIYFLRLFYTNDAALIVNFAFLLFLVSAVFWAVAHYSFGIAEQAEQEVLIYNLVFALNLFALFLVGALWPSNDSFSPNGLFLAFVLITLIVFLNTPFPNLFFLSDVYYSNTNESLVTYQGYARSYSIIVIFLLVYLNNFYKRYFVLILGLIGLFLVGARSEFYGMLILLPIFWLFELRANSRRALLSLVVFILTAVAIATAFWDIIWDTRILRLINFAQDTSFISRSQAAQLGLAAIAENPVLGDYAGQVRSGQGFGSYMHNGLSAWRQFGLFPFLLFSFSLIAAVLSSMKFIVSKRTDSMLWRLVFVLSVFSTVLLIAAKSVYWASLGLTWGVFVAALSEKRDNFAQEDLTLKAVD